MTAAQTTDAPAFNFPALWVQIDAIQCVTDEADDGPGPLARAVDAVEMVRAELAKGHTLNVGAMVYVLGLALRHLHQVETHVYELVDSLGEAEGWGRMTN